MSTGRIGRVTMKAGGADVRVLSRPEIGECGESLLSEAREAVSAPKKIVAYALVAMESDGIFFSSARTAFPDEMVMNRHAFVGMAAEAIRDALITRVTAVRTVNRANGWEE